MPDVLTLTAPGKLNLALSVGPPGPDGIHPICSWMVTIDLGDELTVTKLAEDRLSRYAIIWHDDARRRSEIDWSITDDLAVRAHLALERHAGRKLPVQMKLEKRLPVGGGLGGGSSDAAAMLRAVNELYGLGLTPDELAEIGSGIGADVPFLVRGGSAIVEGLGERIEPHDEIPELHTVVIFPEARCPTKEVYRRFDDDDSAALKPDAVRSLADQFARDGSDPDALFNDLAKPAGRVAPTLDDALTRLGELAERRAHVSGSGSTLFVVCDDPMHAEALAAAVEHTLDLPAIAVTTCPLTIPDPA